MTQANGSPHDVPDIDDSILAYLARSPDALDTARGVCDQWLSGLNPRPSQDSVERALERLYRRGLLARETHNGAEPLWSAPNPAGGPEA